VISFFHGRIRDFAVYLIVAFSIGAAAIWLGVHDADARSTGKWLGLGVHTLILFGYLIKSFRALWRRRSFWLIMTLAFLLHCSTFAIVLIRVVEWRLVWFVLLYVPEFLAVRELVCRLVELKKYRVGSFESRD
jgi:hypothetical protein